MSLLDVPRSTYYARKAAEEARQDPANAKPRGRPPLVPDDALLAAIQRVIAESPFVGEGHKKVHVRLRLAGVRATVTRVLRIMRENGLLAPTRLGNAHGPKAHDGSITPSRPDEIWGTDMTQTLLESGLNAAIFAVVDHATSECLGLFAAERGRRFEAVEALRQAVHHRGLKADKDALVGVKLRHDHGSQFIAEYFQKEVTFLGMTSSPAFVREPQGNGTAERFFRTLKENLLWLRRFSDVASLQVALDEFRLSYNVRWLIGRHGYVSPTKQHRRLLAKVSQAA